MDNKENIYLLDARGADEYEQTRLGLGETLIPIGMLRKRMDELHKDKSRKIVTFCKNPYGDMKQQSC